MTDKQLLETLVKGQEELKLEVSRIRKTVREEVEIEAKKTRHEARLAELQLSSQLEELEDTVKDLKIGSSKLEKNQEEFSKEQKAQSKDIKTIKKKLDKTYKVVNYIALDFDERIVNIDKRTDRIEDHLNLPAFKNKQ